VKSEQSTAALDGFDGLHSVANGECDSRQPQRAGVSLPLGEMQAAGFAIRWQ